MCCARRWGTLGPRDPAHGTTAAACQTAPCWPPLHMTLCLVAYRNRLSFPRAEHAGRKVRSRLNGGGVGPEYRKPSYKLAYVKLVRTLCSNTCPLCHVAGNRFRDEPPDGCARGASGLTRLCGAWPGQTPLDGALRHAKTFRIQLGRAKDSTTQDRALAGWQGRGHARVFNGWHAHQRTDDRNRPVSLWSQRWARSLPQLVSKTAPGGCKGALRPPSAPC